MMKTLLITAVLILIDLLPVIPMDAEVNGLQINSTHDPISIDGDEDLVQTAFDEGWKGTGTPQDPFVIEDLEIDGDSDYTCIELLNTSYSVQIRNCTVTNVDESDYDWDKAGIHLYNTTDIRILNITSSECVFGVLVQDSSNIMVEDSRIKSSYMAIYSIRSENITVAGSNLTNCDFGFYAGESNHVLIMNCNISIMERGINIKNGINMTILKNNISICQYGVTYEVNSIGYDLVIENNHFNNIFFDGIVLFSTNKAKIIKNYFENITLRSVLSFWINYNLFIVDNIMINQGQKGIEVRDGNINGARGIASYIHNNTIIGSLIGIYVLRNVEIRGNNITGSVKGIVSESGTLGYNNLIISNTVTNCEEVGIQVGYDVIVEENEIMNCNEGMRLYGSNTTARYNLIHNCTLNGTTITGDDIHLEENVIYGCGMNGIYLSGSGNVDLTRDYIYENTGNGITSINSGPTIYIGTQIHNNGGVGLSTLDNYTLTLRNVSASQNNMVNLNLRCRDDISATGLELYSTETGAFVMSPENVEISDSDFFDLETGINIYQFGSMKMDHNSFDGCGIYLSGPEGPSGMDLSGMDLGTTNRVNGRKLYLIDDSYDEIKLPADSGQLIIYNSNLHFADNLDLSDATIGLIMIGSQNIRVGNTSLDDNIAGILAFDCESIDIVGSSFRNDISGIEFRNVTTSSIEGNGFLRCRGKAVFLEDDSRECSIRENLFFGSIGTTSYAIESFAGETDVYGNHFIYNRGSGDEYATYLTQVIDPLSKVKWSFNGKGNYWRDHHKPDLENDGIVDSPYFIEPSYLTNDPYPLARSYLFDPPVLDLSILIDPPRAILNWQEPDLGKFVKVLNYTIYRREFSGEPEIIAILPTDQTSYMDLNVSYGRDYSYSISVLNDLFEGDRSREIMTDFQVELPVLEIIDPWEGNVTGEDNMQVEWSVDNLSRVDHFEVRIDLMEWKNVGHAFTYRFINLSEGTHIVKIKAVAVTGGDVIQQITFMVDMGKPSITIITPEDGSVLAANITKASWTATDDLSDIQNYLVSLDDDEAFSISGASFIMLINLSDGYHTLTITAFDKGGNSDTDEIVFRVDTFKPAIEITGPQEGLLTRSRDIKVTWNAYDIGSGLELFSIKLDDQDWFDISPERTERSFWQLDDGRHDVKVLARDLAGNTNTTNVSFTIDATTPELFINSPIDGSHISQAPVSVQWSVSDAVSGVDRVEFKDNSSEWEKVPANHIALPGLEEGTYTVWIRAFDKVGNVVEASTTFTVDRTPPVVLGYGPTGSNEPLDEPVFVSFSERMNKGTLRITVEGVTGKIIWQGERAVFEPAGKLDPGITYNVTVTGSDLAGNTLEMLEWSFTTTVLGKVRGRVVDKNGNSLGEARITIGGEGSDSRPDGGFFIELVNGTYKMRISKDGYRSMTISVDISAGEINDLGEVVLKDEKDEGLNLLAVIMVPLALILMVLLVLIIGNFLKAGRKLDEEE